MTQAGKTFTKGISHHPWFAIRQGYSSVFIMNKSRFKGETIAEFLSWQWHHRTGHGDLCGGEYESFYWKSYNMMRVELLLSLLNHPIQGDRTTFGSKFGPSLKGKFEKIVQARISKVLPLPQGKIIAHEIWYDRMHVIIFIIFL
jgi:hypothetical protein